MIPGTKYVIYLKGCTESKDLLYLIFMRLSKDGTAYVFHSETKESETIYVPIMNVKIIRIYEYREGDIK